MKSRKHRFLPALCLYFSACLCPDLTVAQEEGATLFGVDPLPLAPAALFGSGGSGSAGPASTEVATPSLSFGASPVSVAVPTAFALEGAEPSGGGTYLVGKLGPLWYLDDLEDLGAGLDFEALIGVRLIPFLSLEFGSGYIWGEDDSGSTEGELWGVPVLAQLRVAIPVLFFEPYAGAGVGAYYFHVEVREPGPKAENDSLTFGWNIFAGVNFNLGPLFIGGEVKYLRTQDIAAPGKDPNLDGIAALVCVGVGF
jgi:opacity protein-like surface antigen